jgi:hypothetical protein
MSSGVLIRASAMLDHLHLRPEVSFMMRSTLSLAPVSARSECLFWG